MNASKFCQVNHTTEREYNVTLHGEKKGEKDLQLPLLFCPITLNVCFFNIEICSKIKFVQKKVIFQF